MDEVRVLNNFPFTGGATLMSFDEFREARQHLDGFGSGENGEWTPEDEAMMIEDTHGLVMSEQQKLMDSYDDPIAAFAIGGDTALSGEFDASEIPKRRAAPVYIDGRYELREKEFAGNRQRRAQEADLQELREQVAGLSVEQLPKYEKPEFSLSEMKERLSPSAAMTPYGESQARVQKATQAAMPKPAEPKYGLGDYLSDQAAKQQIEREPTEQVKYVEDQQESGTPGYGFLSNVGEAIRSAVELEKRRKSLPE